MNVNIQKFLEKLSQDPELIAKMGAIRDPDEAYRLASSVQDGFTKEEFINTMKDIAALKGELSDDDLKKFAGGSDVTEVVSEVTEVSVGVGLVVAASSI